MTFVTDVLTRKGRDVWTVSSDSTVYEALQEMADKNVGALMVVDRDKLVGVFSERDYARKIILHGKASKDTLVKVWAAGDRLRRDEEGQSMIFRLDKSRLYVVDHEDKTYSEILLPIDIRKLMPKGSEAMADQIAAARVHESVDDLGGAIALLTRAWDCDPDRTLTRELIAALLGRVAMRVGFTIASYGLAEGLLSIPRMLVGNIVAMLAAFHALMGTMKLRTDITVADGQLTATCEVRSRPWCCHARVVRSRRPSRR